jgi:DNA/RNA endonuclease G (NUC1)
MARTRDGKGTKPLAARRAARGRGRPAGWLLLLGAFVAACAAPEAPSRPTKASTSGEPARAAAEAPAPAPAVPAASADASAPPAAESTDPLEAKNCIEGLPRLTKDHEGGVRIVRRRGYVLVHASKEKDPLFFCEGIPWDQLDGPAQRKDNFRPDPELPSGERAELVDYKGSGYDRGHQAPAEDMSKDQELMDDSFYLSNMCPQVGIGFNQHIWAELESWTRDEIRQHGGGWVITWPLFLGGEGKTIGPDKVAVPSHFFKVVVVKGTPPPAGARYSALSRRRPSCFRRDATLLCRARVRGVRVGDGDGRLRLVGSAAPPRGSGAENPRDWGIEGWGPTRAPPRAGLWAHRAVRAAGQHGLLLRGRLPGGEAELDSLRGANQAASTMARARPVLAPAG